MRWSDCGTPDIAAVRMSSGGRPEFGLLTELIALGGDKLWWK